MKFDLQQPIALSVTSWDVRGVSIDLALGVVILQVNEYLADGSVARSRAVGLTAQQAQPILDALKPLLGTALAPAAGTPLDPVADPVVDVAATEAPPP